jgi:hypothetical protein
MKTLPDQKDVDTENAQLELQARNLRAQLAAKGQPVAAMDSKQFFDVAIQGTDTLRLNAGLKAHVATLRAAMDGNPTLATGAQAAPVQGDSLTARILAAKGVKTLAELPTPSGLD